MFLIPSNKAKFSHAIGVMKKMDMSCKNFAADLDIPTATVKAWQSRTNKGDDGWIQNGEVGAAIVTHMIELNIKEALKEAKEPVLIYKNVVITKHDLKIADAAKIGIGEVLDMKLGKISWKRLAGYYKSELENDKWATIGGSLRILLALKSLGQTIGGYSDGNKN